VKSEICSLRLNVFPLYMGRISPLEYPLMGGSRGYFSWVFPPNKRTGTYRYVQVPVLCTVKFQILISGFKIMRPVETRYCRESQQSFAVSQLSEPCRTGKGHRTVAAH
jgi:hypothetical protein